MTILLDRWLHKQNPAYEGLHFLSVNMTTIIKPEKIIKRIIKAIGQRQSTLVIGEWEESLINGIKENQNSLNQLLAINTSTLEDNSFTRIIVDYGTEHSAFNSQIFFNEARRLLLPTGMIIVSANCEKSIFEKLGDFFQKNKIKSNEIKIKPKFLQDQIHDNEFLIDGYYGYPDGHLLMMAQIINKEVSTLFASNKQETIKL